MRHSNFAHTGMVQDTRELLNLTINITTTTMRTSQVSLETIVLLSIVFCVIGATGIIGNVLVIYIITIDQKMRQSVTNLFLLNLACSDLLLMLFGLPEIVQFMLDQGWLLGLLWCKIQRYVLVISLYSSVTTLVSVCIERYIAIVYPLKARIYCNKRKMLAVIMTNWMLVMAFGAPVAAYNKLIRPVPSVHFCSLHLPISRRVLYKYAEFFTFYLVPMVIQITCYAIIGRRLFASTVAFSQAPTRSYGSTVSASGRNSIQVNVKSRDGSAMDARKGVVKMLIASVLIYFISYSPHQVLLFYNTFAPVPFVHNWIFIVSVTIMGYINSAANPVLYCIFSSRFREHFRAMLHCKKLGR